MKRRQQRPGDDPLEPARQALHLQAIRLRVQGTLDVDREEEERLRERIDSADRKQITELAEELELRWLSDG